MQGVDIDQLDSDCSQTNQELLYILTAQQSSSQNVLRKDQGFSLLQQQNARVESTCVRSPSALQCLPSCSLKSLAVSYISPGACVSATVQGSVPKYEPL